MPILTNPSRFNKQSPTKPRRSGRFSILILLAHVLLVGAFWAIVNSKAAAGLFGTAPAQKAAPHAAAASNDPVVGAAGDIACSPNSPSFNNTYGTDADCKMRATSDLLLAMKPHVVLPLGDIQYEKTEKDKLMASYDPTWGRLKDISRPAIGNHEGGEGFGSGDYFDYFGEAAGDRTKGYYSFNLGKWHLIALNSNCGIYSFEGDPTICEADSPQVQWLRDDLAANAGKCTLAYWHVPYYSSGHAKKQEATQHMRHFWQVLYDAKADLVLSGHDHDYERFKKMDADGRATDDGIAQFVVGTGGRYFTPMGERHPNSVTVNTTAQGVLKLVLHADSYDWEFVPIPGKSFADKGTAACNK